QHCNGTTDAYGFTTCTLVVIQAGPLPLTVNFDGDATHASAYDTRSFTATPEESAASYLGPTAVLQGSTITLRGRLVEDGNPAKPLVQAPLTLGVGTQQCTGLTGSNGVATCTLTYTGALGPTQASAHFAGDGVHSPSTSSTTAIVFAYAGAGAAF